MTPHILILILIIETLLTQRRTHWSYKKLRKEDAANERIQAAESAATLHGQEKNHIKAEEEVKGTDIKHDVESLNTDKGGVPFESAFKRRAYFESPELFKVDVSDDVIHRGESESLKICKQEVDVEIESGDTMVRLIASHLDNARQGLLPNSELILHFERSCCKFSESMHSAGSLGFMTINKKDTVDKIYHRMRHLLYDGELALDGNANDKNNMSLGDISWENIIIEENEVELVLFVQGEYKRDNEFFGNKMVSSKKFSSYSEVNAIVLLMVLLYNRHIDIITLENAYHGGQLKYWFSGSGCRWKTSCHLGWPFLVLHLGDKVACEGEGNVMSMSM